MGGALARQCSKASGRCGSRSALSLSKAHGRRAAFAKAAHSKARVAGAWQPFELADRTRLKTTAGSAAARDGLALPELSGSACRREQ